VNIYKVFIVLCRIDGQTEFDSVYATEQLARAHCDRHNSKPIYYGRCTWHPTKVIDERTVDTSMTDSRKET